MGRWVYTMYDLEGAIMFSSAIKVGLGFVFWVTVDWVWVDWPGSVLSFITHSQSSLRRWPPPASPTQPPLLSQHMPHPAHPPSSPTPQWAAHLPGDPCCKTTSRWSSITPSTTSTRSRTASRASQTSIRPFLRFSTLTRCVLFYTVTLLKLGWCKNRMQFLIPSPFSFSEGAAEC